MLASKSTGGLAVLTDDIAATELHGLEGVVKSVEVTDDIATWELHGRDGGVDTVDVTDDIATEELTGLEGGVKTVDVTDDIATEEFTGLEGGVKTVDVTDDEIAANELHDLVLEVRRDRNRENAVAIFDGMLGRMVI